MKTKSQATFLLILTVIPVLLNAQGLSTQTLNRLIRLSGIQEQTSQLPLLISAGFQQANDEQHKISDSDIAAATATIQESFAPDRIIARVREQVDGALTEQDAATILTWYESELGRRITAAEEGASTPEDYNAMFANAQTLLDDQERVSIAKGLESLLNTVDWSVEIQIHSIMAMLSAIAAIQDPSEQTDLEQVKSQLSAQEEQIREHTLQITLLSYVYMYRDLPISDLDNYLAFLGRPESKRFNDAAFKGLKRGLVDAIDDMAKQLVVQFKK